ncbi:CHAT domain-containing protein [Streptomyces sp. NPDC005799]|uniref:CHAT domain-containing protein n=1 Tax=Streptomyces sp. NPDC005799 TaxID=3154678 RepID=UPI0033CA2D9A
MSLAREWDELVDQVRELNGFKDFLRPPTLETLRPAASGGPIVIVNVSRWRCDALIVTEDGVAQRPLPDLTLDQAAERAQIYLETLRDAELAAAAHESAQKAVDDNPVPVAIRAQLRAAEALMEAESRTDHMLRLLQEWLWDAIAAPVVGELELERAPARDEAWPRIWWCPTGPLTLLPLHAAGYHATGRSTAGNQVPRTVIDRAVSSYTPTLRALLEARRAAPLPALGTRRDNSEYEADALGTTCTARVEGDRVGEETDRLLIVAVEDAPGQPVLHNVARERELLTRLFPPERRTLLQGRDANRENVDKELARHRWVHFSCHGDQNLNEPSHGGLLLHDGGMLSVADIAARRFRGDFAGLSACKTAVGGINLLDEMITLAAALHYTGYRHVVSALWSVDDETSASVFTAVYSDITADGRLRPDGAAVALHHAVRALRDAAPDEPRLWIPFTHTGP